ncbi:hypothetical protein BV20DRAFT_120467 [Pilatotrama ljubarskyi]|nr:hypothetical protein BV20DRAFT_120467 [Pilatotrama ljubarskyi]
MSGLGVRRRRCRLLRLRCASADSEVRRLEAWYPRKRIAPYSHRAARSIAPYLHASLRRRYPAYGMQDRHLRCARLDSAAESLPPEVPRLTNGTAARPLCYSVARSARMFHELGCTRMHYMYNYPDTLYMGDRDGAGGRQGNERERQVQLIYRASEHCERKVVLCYTEGALQTVYRSEAGGYSGRKDDDGAAHQLDKNIT